MEPHFQWQGKIYQYILSPTLWFDLCPQSFHKVNEARFYNIESQRSKADCMLGQCADHWQQQTEGRKSFPGDQVSSGEPEICCEQEEITPKASQRIEFLDFIIESVAMTISLPPKKR